MVIIIKVIVYFLNWLCFIYFNYFQFINYKFSNYLELANFHNINFNNNQVVMVNFLGNNLILEIKILDLNHKNQINFVEINYH